MQPPPIMQCNNPPQGTAGSIQVFPLMPQRALSTEAPLPVAPRSIVVGQP